MITISVLVRAPRIISSIRFLDSGTTKYPRLPCCVRSFCDGRKPFVSNGQDEETVWDQWKREAALVAGDRTENVLLIQPKIKFGKERYRKPEVELRLSEAIALVETLPKWNVLEQLIVPLESSLRKKQFFGSGKLQELTEKIRSSDRITSVFINLDMLSGMQHAVLSQAFRVPIYDRYNIVLQIFRTYAKTKEAKLQIALAEIPYLRARMRKVHDGEIIGQSIGSYDHAGGAGETFWQMRKRLLQKRELRLREQLDAIQRERKTLREKQLRSKSHPTVAVVGYTNAGKTSLIQCLTKDASLVPQDRLFATLDVTTHTGTLPLRTTALFMDTVGFIQDIPTELIASFSATLDDIRFADLLVHIRDVSHPDAEAQKQTILQTLKSLSLPEKLTDCMIEANNKVDRCESDSVIPEKVCSDLVHYISCKEGWGMKQLAACIEKKLMTVTHSVESTLTIPIGESKLLGVLYNETAVQNITPSEDARFLVVRVIATETTLRRIESRFDSDLFKRT